MPRRNVLILAVGVCISMVCYQKANSEYRSRYGQMFGTFVNVLEQIDRNYLEEVDDTKLFQGAMEGMVGKLDPYSGYMGPVEATEFNETLGKTFGGVGIEVSWDRETQTLLVMSPLAGTPAYEAGILAGDRIIAIDGEGTETFDLQGAIQRLRGEPGEPVRLAVLREGIAKPFDIRIERAEIKVDTVWGDTRDADGTWNFMLPGEPAVAYIRITSFSERTLDEFRNALAKISDQGARSLIIDLRNNAGGLLTSAIEMCDLFVKEGLIVTTRGRDKTVLESYAANDKTPYATLPLAVLVNRFSASASEIVAACLQDRGRAIVVGERTWGKGTVQTLIPLERGKSMLRLTTASYWRPSGKNIHRTTGSTEKEDWGVRPNPGFEVKLTDEELIQLNERRRQRDIIQHPGDSTSTLAPAKDFDPPLRRAIDALKGSSERA